MFAPLSGNSPVVRGQGAAPAAPAGGIIALTGILDITTILCLLVAILIGR